MYLEIGRCYAVLSRRTGIARHGCPRRSVVWARRRQRQATKRILRWRLEVERRGPMLIGGRAWAEGLAGIGRSRAWPGTDWVRPQASDQNQRTWRRAGVSVLKATRCWSMPLAGAAMESFGKRAGLTAALGLE